MPKGQTPKLKGAICNVPIDTNDIVNTKLPQGADSNGIIMLKLKCKLLYRGHVYFEAVSPGIVRSALHYLKLNNPLYSDIEIDIGLIPEELLCLLTEPVDIPIEIIPESKSLDSSNSIEEDDSPLDEFRLAATETMLFSNIPQVEYLVICTMRRFAISVTFNG